MFSVQYTGMNLWPLWTAKVSAIMSGVIIERRDQVLMIRLSPLADAELTFFSRCPSTNGPFFSDLAICLMLPARPAADDQIVRRLLLARLVSLRRHPPRRLRMVSFRLALAPAVRMVNRVHRDAAHVAALAQPSRASRLADRDIFVVEVADLADSG